MCPNWSKSVQICQACLLNVIKLVQIIYLKLHKIVRICLKLFNRLLFLNSLYFLVFQVDIDSITPVSVTEEEFLKRKEAADTHDEEAAEVNIDFFLTSSNPKLYIPSTAK